MNESVGSRRRRHSNRVVEPSGHEASESRDMRRLSESAIESSDNAPGSVRYALRDGRWCKLCGVKDTDADPIFPAERVYWAEFPRYGKPQGCFCLYCQRVHQRRYAVIFASIEKLVDKCSIDVELLAVVKEWRHKLVQHIQESDCNRSARMKWEKADAKVETLVTNTGAELRLEEPEDLVMSEGEYTRKYGDVDQNGLGHRKYKLPCGKAAVLMPGERIWKIKRARVQSTKHSVVHIDTNNDASTLGEDNLSANLMHFTSALMSSGATGVHMSLNSILGLSQPIQRGSQSGGGAVDETPRAPKRNPQPINGSPSTPSSTSQFFGMFSVEPAGSSGSSAAVPPSTPAKGKAKTKGKPAPLSKNAL